MSWPTNPLNGQQVAINGMTYQYNSSDSVWSGCGSAVGGGAIRIIWPGNLRQFPSTRTANE